MLNHFINKYKYWNEILSTRRILNEFSNGHQAHLYNWSKPVIQDAWLINFIEQRGLLNNKPKVKIGLYSIFAPFWLSKFDGADVRLFVERENLHKPLMQSWLHRFLNDDRINLSLGFDKIEHPQYMRFPFWIMWSVFSPDATYDEIKARVKAMDSSLNHSFDDRKFCAYLCSHNDKGRRKMYEQFSTIDQVYCDGKLFHNNDELKQIFHDDKLSYLKQYRFNLTPENTNHEGYVTEKLFEAISSGCIPIYNGSDNKPEPEILNHNAIIFIEVGGDNISQLKLVDELNKDKKSYIEFSNQRRFKPEAPELIWSYYLQLEDKIKEIILNL